MFVLKQLLQLLQVVQMLLIVQRRVVLNHFIVQHYQMLHDLRTGQSLQGFLVMFDLVKQLVYLVDASLIAAQEVLLRLFHFVVVLIDSEALSLKVLDDYVHAFARVLHDHLKRSRRLVPPNEGYAVWVVKISLYLLQCPKSKPTHHCGHVFNLLIRLQVEYKLISYHCVEVA